MSKIQVVETFLSRVIHECESMASLQKWLSENCYCIYGKNLYLKANDERIFVRYNGSDPLPEVNNNKMTIASVLEKMLPDTKVMILGYGICEYEGKIEDINPNGFFMNYEVERIFTSTSGGCICICIDYKD